MNSIGSSNERVLQCALHGTAHELLFCNDCKCIVCAICCAGRKAPHHNHDCEDLESAGMTLPQHYGQLSQTVVDLKLSTITAVNDRRNFVSEVEASAEQALISVNELIDSAISRLEAIRLTVAIEIQVVAARKNLECTSKAQLQRQRRLRFAAARLSQKIDEAQQGSFSALVVDLPRITDEFQKFERTYQDLQMQEYNVGEIAVDEQTELETLVDNCRTVASRIDERFKRVERNTAVACVGSSSCLAAGSDAIFVVGVGDVSKGTLAYDLANNKWCLMASTSQARTRAAATGWKNKLIVTGGCESFNSAEQYDPESNKWSTFPDLITGRHQHALVNLNGDLYVIGGSAVQVYPRSSLLATTSVERFDEQTQQWTKAPSLVVARFAAAAASTSRNIVVIGGNDSMQECEIFEPTSKQWKLIANLNLGRHNAAAASATDVVFVFGGRNSKYGYLNDVEQYNETYNRWTEIRTRTAAGCLTALFANDFIYLVSGNARRIESFDAETWQSVQVALIPKVCTPYVSAATLKLSTKALSRLHASALL